MRKVIFKKWIPIQYDGNFRPIPNTGRWEDDYTMHGVFHQWTISYERTESGYGNSTTLALVETPEGTVVELPLNAFKFVNEGETVSNAKLFETASELLNACKWAKEQFMRLANDGLYPEFMLTENGGDGVMPLVRAIKSATDNGIV